MSEKIDKKQKIEDPEPYSTILIEYQKENLFKIFRNMHGFLNEIEYKMVSKGFRQANVYHMVPENFDKQIERIMEDGLVFLPIHRTSRYSGFSHCHIFTDSLDLGSMVYGVVAKDLNTAKQFRDAQTNNFDHKTTGDLLGYPKCCSEAFNEYFQKSYDPIWEPAINTEGSYLKDKILYVPHYNPKILQHLRYFGPRIVPWFPCNFLCEESSEKAEIWFNLMKETNEELAKNILDILNVKGTTWDLYNAQVISKIPGYGIGVAASYYTEEHRIIYFGEEGE